MTAESNKLGATSVDHAEAESRRFIRPVALPVQGGWPLYVAIMAIISVYFLFPNQLNQHGFIDPWVYRGYMIDYEQMSSHFGKTYYGARLPHILLGSLFYRNFDVEIATMLHRLMLYIPYLAFILYFTLRSVPTPFQAAFALMLALAPLSLRGILNDLYDGFALVSCMGAIVFVRAPLLRKHLSWCISAFFFVLAIFSNLAAGLVVSLYYLAQFVSDLWFDRRQELVARTATVAASTLLFAIMLSLAVFAFVDLYGPMSFFQQFVLGYTSVVPIFGNWWVSHYDMIFSIGIYQMIPMILTAALLVLLFRKATAKLGRARQRELFETALYGTLLSATLLIEHAIGGAWLTVHYYNIYAIPFVMLSIGALLILASEGGRDSKVGISAFAAVVAFYLGIGYIYVAENSVSVGPQLELMLGRAFFPLVAVFLVAVCLVMSARGGQPARGAVWVLFCGALLFPYATPGGLSWKVTGMHDARAARFEMDVARGADSLVREVGAVVPSTASLGFWYPDTDVPNAIQSTFLWGYSRLFWDAESALPNLTETVLNNIYQREYTILIWEEPNQRHEAEQRLTDAGFSYEVVKDVPFSSPSFSFGFTVLRRL